MKFLTIILAWLLAVPTSGIEMCHEEPVQDHGTASSMHQHTPVMDMAATSLDHQHQTTACGNSALDCNCMHLTSAADIHLPLALQSPDDDYPGAIEISPDFRPDLVKPPPRTIS